MDWSLEAVVRDASLALSTADVKGFMQQMLQVRQAAGHRHRHELQRPVGAAYQRLVE